MSQRTDRVRQLSSSSRFRIGASLVQPDRLVVVVDGKEVALEPRVMEVLVALAEHAGEVVSAEQLLIEVWRGSFYGDNPVHKAIAHLRRVFGDDSRAPRYIETIRKRGYRLIAPVSFPEDYRRDERQSSAWSGRSPYVGLSAFGDAHADVFFGRSRMTARALAAIRHQIDHQRRFVLLLGASGCGKTSLLRAGVLPLLRQPGGFDGLSARAVASCDLADVHDGAFATAVAEALSGWVLSDRPVFAADDPAARAARLSAHPGAVASAVEEAFRRDTLRDARREDEATHAHLLLIVDHAERLVAQGKTDTDEAARFTALVEALCDCPRVMVLMVARSDFYPKLVDAFPTLVERKSGDGHLDVTTPRPGEIAQIIRAPAMLAGLRFEEDPQTQARLDDVLRDAASAQPDALPLLQHTLQSLYERRGEDGTLRFDAYRAIGGLEGAIAHRAEEVFATLPEPARARLDSVLAQLIALQPDSDSLSARRVPLSALQDEHAAVLVEAFVRTRLFVGVLDGDTPSFGVAHEALLRQWPRAREWSQDNRRQLLALERLRRATVRWVEEGRHDDHLLNPGQPLAEATEAARAMPARLDEDERALLAASQAKSRRGRRLRTAAVASLTLLAILASLLALWAVGAQREAERRRDEALQLTDFMLVDLAEKLRPLGRLQLLDDISGKALGLLDRQPPGRLRTEDLVNRSRALRTLGEVLMEEARFDAADNAFAGADRAARLAAERAPTSTAAIAEAGIAAYWLGYADYRRDDYRGAERHWTAYLQRSEQLVKLEPDKVDWLVELSYAQNNLGTVARDRHRIDEALDRFRKSAALKKRALALSPDNDALRYDLIDTQSWISGGEESRGDLSRAAAGYAEQIAMLRTLIARHPDARAWERRLATSLLRSAMLAADTGRLDDAERAIVESIQRLRALTTLEPDNRVWARDLAHALLEGGGIAAARGDARERRSRLEEARTRSAALRTQEDAPPEWRRLDAMIQLELAKNAAPEAFDPPVAALRDLARHVAQDPVYRVALANALIARGIARQHAGATEAARSDWRESLSWLAPVLADAGRREPKAVSARVHAEALLGHRDRITTDVAWLRGIGYRLPPEVPVSTPAARVPSATRSPVTASPATVSPGSAPPD